MRGFSAVSLMLIDEASRVPDAVYRALRPMLAVGGGDLWLLSTPFGKRGFFYEAWEHGGDRWARFRLPVDECGRIPADFVEDERRELGDLWFRQEYLCEFLDNGNGACSGGNWWKRHWRRPRCGWEGPQWPVAGRPVSFVVGLDLGKRQDFTAVAVVEREERALAWMPAQYNGLTVRHLERMPLGTPYPKVVERVKKLVAHRGAGGTGERGGGRDGGGRAGGGSAAGGEAPVRADGGDDHGREEGDGAGRVPERAEAGPVERLAVAAGGGRVEDREEAEGGGITGEGADRYAEGGGRRGA